METFNIYLFKALNAYPYDLEEAIEALNYALAYEPHNVKALCLMGKIYVEQLGEYESAKECYAKAMASQMEVPGIYPDYIRTMLTNDDYNEAEKLIDFALTVKGVDKASIYLLKGQLLEGKKMYIEAITSFKTAKEYGFNNDFIRFANDEISRVKKKLSKRKKKNKKRKEVINP